MADIRDLLAAAKAATRTEEVIDVESIIEYDFEIGSKMTPCQRAASRVIDNKPLGELCYDPDVQQMLNMSDLTPNDPRLKSSLFVLVSGIRTAKSLMACARVIASTQTVDVTGLGPGEIPESRSCRCRRTSRRST